MQLDIREITAESEYEKLSDAAVEELAVAVLEERVFGSWMLKDHEMHLLGAVFMPLVLSTDIQRKEFVRDGMAHVWQFYNEQMPRMVNGLPTFDQMNILDEDDSERLRLRLAKLEQDYQK